MRNTQGYHGEQYLTCKSQLKETNILVDDNRVRVVKERVVKVILEAMSNNTDNVNVCQHGCRALWNISVTGKLLVPHIRRYTPVVIEESRSIIRGAEAIEVVLDVVKRHIENVDVCKQGYRTLYILLIDSISSEHHF